jgi:hypothetical protein
MSERASQARQRREVERATESRGPRENAERFRGVHVCWREEAA